MACKVVFLGAGSSVDAGYPLCKNIFDFLEENCRNSVINNVKDDWKIFGAFRADNKRYQMMNVEEFYTELESIISKNGSESFKCEKVRDALGRMIDFCFGMMNHNYQTLKSNNRLKYFENMISGSKYIITVNWDNLSEFILADNNKWHPVDGYGIPIKLIRMRNFRRVNVGGVIVKPNPQQEDITGMQSQIKVLKLHGSMGWRKNNNGKLYLRRFDFLRYVPRLDSDEIKDINEPEMSGDDYYSGSVMIFPSYNKKPDNHGELKKIWREAKNALEAATEVVFIGYSLPDADKHIIDLLENLRKKIDSNKVCVKCVVGKNDNNGTGNRYFNLFGEKIEVIPDDARDYYLRQSTDIFQE